MNYKYSHSHQKMSGSVDISQQYWYHNRQFFISCSLHTWYFSVYIHHKASRFVLQKPKAYMKYNTCSGGNLAKSRYTAIISQFRVSMCSVFRWWPKTQIKSVDISYHKTWKFRQKGHGMFQLQQHDMFSMKRKFQLLIITSSIQSYYNEARLYI